MRFFPSLEVVFNSDPGAKSLRKKKKKLHAVFLEAGKMSWYSF